MTQPTDDRPQSVTEVREVLASAPAAAMVLWEASRGRSGYWVNAAAVQSAPQWWSHRDAVVCGETMDNRWAALARALWARWTEGVRQGPLDMLGAALKFRAQVHCASDNAPTVLLVWLEPQPQQRMTEPVDMMPPAVARYALDHTSDLLILSNARREIVWVNQRFERFTGYSTHDVRGQAPGEVLSGPHTSAETLRWTREQLVQGKGFQDVDIVFHTRKGTPYWARLTVDPIIDAQGCVVGYLDFQNDVSWEHELRDAARAQSLDQHPVNDPQRVATWDWSIVSGQGRWDQQLIRLHGLDPANAITCFEDLLDRVEPADVHRVTRIWHESLVRLGRAQVRYALKDANGKYKEVQALWEVLPGPDGRPGQVSGVMLESDGVQTSATRHVLPALAAQFDLAVELAQIYIWRHDLASDAMHFNAATFQALGWPMSPDLSIPLADLRARVHPDDVAEVAAAAQRALRSPVPVMLETRYRHGDGSYRTMLTRRVAQRDEHGRPVALLGVAIDITERVREQQHTRTLHERLEMVAQAAGVGVWRIDIDSGESEWNAEMFRIYGLPEPAGASPLGQGPQARQWMDQLVHEDDRERLAQQRRRSWSANEPVFDVEFRVVRPDGTVRWVACRSRRETWQGRQISFGIHLDVTEQRQAEQALREARERTALAARLAGVGTWAYDLRTHAWQGDEQMPTLLGWTEEQAQALGTDWDAVWAQVHAQDAPSLDAARANALTGGDTQETELRICHPDGSVTWLATRLTVQTDMHDQPVRLLGVNWDITQYRQAQEAHQARVTAEKANRAKSDFLARMSHELRTPLNAVLGFTQLLQAEGAETLSLRQRSKLGHIHSAAEHLLALINDILDLVRIEAGTHKVEDVPVAMRAVIEEAVQLTEPLARQHQVGIHVDVQDLHVRGDETRLRQVLINLLSNAVKYNRHGGSVWVSLTGGLTPTGTGTDTRAGDAHATWVRLTVRDDGRGMSAQQIDRMFDPFERLGAERDGIDGTGIGMSIVQHLVECMGGMLQVRSQVGSGSEFDVWLRQTTAPALGRAHVPTAPPRMPELSTPSAILRVVYIEDNPVNALLIEELVALRTGVTLSVATDGLSGVERIRQMKPDVALIDMQLPDIDGMEVLRQIRMVPETAKLRCIALSANALPGDIQRALDAGFDDYWTKPIEFETFMTRLDGLLADRRRSGSNAYGG